jgi:hypothetical protein
VALDINRLPEMRKYLAALPRGLDSYPECTIRDIAVEAYARDFGRFGTEPGLPEEVAALFTGRFRSTWLPEVQFQAAHAAVRDLAFADDPSFYRWLYKANVELFDRPVIRSLMRLLSPTLVVIGATRRWSTFHTGSELTTGKLDKAGGREMTLAKLVFPPGLFARCFLEGLEQAFLAALVASRAKEAAVKLEDVASAKAEYLVSWRAG